MPLSASVDGAGRPPAPLARPAGVIASRTVAALATPLLAAAAAPVALTPGLWAVTSAPVQATLDGRPLTDLPYTPPATPEMQCVAPALARTPAALVERQVPDGCTVARRTVTRAGLSLAGTCRPQAAGLPAGAFTLAAQWSATRYRVRFTTLNPSENGRMGFTGVIEGSRVGACPG